MNIGIKTYSVVNSLSLNSSQVTQARFCTYSNDTVTVEISFQSGFILEPKKFEGRVFPGRFTTIIMTI